MDHLDALGAYGDAHRNGDNAAADEHASSDPGRRGRRRRGSRGSGSAGAAVRQARIGAGPSAKYVAADDYYELKQLLGQGSFAEVWRAQDKVGNRKMAVKLYKKRSLKHDHIQMLVKQEIDVMKAVESPNCIKLIDVHDTYRGRHLVMEYATGGSLFAYARKHKYLPEAEAKEVFRQVARGLEAVHNAGACHRDIKLENILFGDDKLLKLADFGLAVFIGEPEKRLSDVCGSLLYMAPEVLLRKKYFGRPVDIWSMGVLLYVLLSGEFPFFGCSENDVIRVISTGKPTWPALISAEARELISLMLAKRPKDRCSIREVLEHSWMQVDLGKTLSSQPFTKAPRKKYRRPTMPNARARLNMVDPDDVGAQELQRAGNEAREARRPHRQGQRHGDREERRGKERRHSKPEVGGKGAARRARGGARGPSPKAGAARSSEPKASHSPTVAAKPRNAAAAAVARRRRRLLAKEISPTSASSAGAESGGSRSTGTDPSVGSPLGRRGAAHGRRRRPAANVAAEVEATPANSNGSASQSSSQAPRQQPRESARAVARRKAAKRAAEAGEFKFLPGRAALYRPPSAAGMLPALHDSPSNDLPSYLQPTANSRRRRYGPSMGPRHRPRRTSAPAFTGGERAAVAAAERQQQEPDVSQRMQRITEDMTKTPHHRTVLTLGESVMPVSARDDDGEGGVAASTKRRPLADAATHGVGNDSLDNLRALAGGLGTTPRVDESPAVLLAAARRQVARGAPAAVATASSPAARRPQSRGAWHEEGQQPGRGRVVAPLAKADVSPLPIPLARPPSPLLSPARGQTSARQTLFPVSSKASNIASPANSVGTGRPRKGGLDPITSPRVGPAKVIATPRRTALSSPANALPAGPVASPHTPAPVAGRPRLKRRMSRKELAREVDQAVAASALTLATDGLAVDLFDDSPPRGRGAGTPSPLAKSTGAATPTRLLARYRSSPSMLWQAKQQQRQMPAKSSPAVRRAKVLSPTRRHQDWLDTAVQRYSIITSQAANREGVANMFASPTESPSGEAHARHTPASGAGAVAGAGASPKLTPSVMSSAGRLVMSGGRTAGGSNGSPHHHMGSPLSRAETWDTSQFDTVKRAHGHRHFESLGAVDEMQNPMYDASLTASPIKSAVGKAAAASARKRLAKSSSMRSIPEA